VRSLASKENDRLDSGHLNPSLKTHYVIWNKSVSGFNHFSTNWLISAALKSQNSAGKVQIGFCTVAGLNAVELVTLYLVQQAEYPQSFRGPQE
jgi:hypothetical protein